MQSSPQRLKCGLVLFLMLSLIFMKRKPRVHICKHVDGCRAFAFGTARIPNWSRGERQLHVRRIVDLALLQICDGQNVVRRELLSHMLIYSQIQQISSPATESFKTV